MAEAVDRDPATSGDLDAEMYELARRLYPICRSITGGGVRETLRIIGEVVPIDVTEVPSGTPVLDWTVPREWNIRDAWIADPSGNRIVDFRRSNLHVVSYSTPIHERMSLAELRPHLHTLPEHPNWIPYRTSYYKEAWGFCLTQRTLDGLVDGEYEVRIDSTLGDGSLTYGEVVVPGTVQDEVLISTHVCHPSLADDNVSGMAVAAFLARHFARRPRRLTLRFLFAPGTIGAITWLSRNQDRVGRIRAGLTLTCLGDSHPFTYKRTVFGAAEIDRVVPRALASMSLPHDVIDYFPYGYDERQYNSPGFRLPVGSLMRGRHGRFPEYHTSADDLSFITAERLGESWRVLERAIELIDKGRRFRNLAPLGEPQLGRRGLYRAIGGTDIAELEHAMLWALSLSDGEHSVDDIVQRSGLSSEVISAAVELLTAKGLLSEV
jgi:aminopeptidase-like protein